MKKDKKVTALIIAPLRREDPAKTLKKLNLDTNAEYTIHNIYRPHVGGIMYEAVKKEKKNG